MYIHIKESIDIHWWGDRLLLVKGLSGIYEFDEVEKIVIECIEEIDEVQGLMLRIIEKYGLNHIETRDLVYTFLDNFRDYLYQSDSVNLKDKFKISGIKGAFYPLELHVSLTSACSQMCVHCYKCANEKVQYIEEDKLCTFLDKMKGITPYLILSGGEPTLHPGFDSIMERYSSSYKITVLTSGYGLNPKTIALMMRSRCNISVSMYSSNAEQHDLFTGRKGSFEQVMNFLKQCTYVQKNISVTTILNGNNYEDVKMLAVLLGNMGIMSLLVGRISLQGRAKEYCKDEFVNNNLYNELLERLRVEVNSLHILSTAEAEGCEEEAGLSPFCCFAGTLLWAIHENGEIHPCGVCAKCEYKMTNLDTFDETILINRSSYDKKIQNLFNVGNINGCPFK